jgi:hypothetical protein
MPRTIFHRLILSSAVAGIACAQTASWVLRNPRSAPVAYSSVLWDGSQYLAFGTGGKIASSPDGSTWTARNSGSTVDLGSAASNGSRTVVVSSPSAISSTDGVQWTTADPWTIPAQVVAWVGNRFVATGITDSEHVSSDGIHWSSIASVPGGGGGLNFTTIRFFPHLAMGWHSGGGSIYTSTDSLTWSACTSSTVPTDIRDIIWMDSLYLAIADGASGAVLYSSTDGQTWVHRHDREWGLVNLVDTTNGARDTSLSILDRFLQTDSVLLAWDGATALFRSTDARSWTRLPALPQGVWGDQSNLFLAHGLYLDLRSSGDIYASTDARTWTLRSPTSATRRSLRSISAGGPLWVAVGDGGAVVTSPDGSDWTLRASNTTRRLSKVLWNGSRYAAFGDSGAVLFSTDGVDWTTTDNGARQNLLDAVWTGSRYVVVGSDDRTFVSTDGMDWTTKALGSGTVLTSIAWSGSTLLLGGSDGSVFTSTDAATWTSRSFKSTAIASATWTRRNFLLGTTSGLYTSADGSTWKKASLVSDTCVAVARQGSTALALTSTGVLTSSTDDSTWAPLNQSVQSIALALAANDSVLVQSGSDGFIYSASMRLGTAGLRNLASDVPNGLHAFGNHLRLDLSASESVEVDVFSADGRHLASLSRGTLAAGTHEFTLADLPRGLLLARARSSSFSATTKIPAR